MIAALAVMRTKRAIFLVLLLTNVSIAFLKVLSVLHAVEGKYVSPYVQLMPDAAGQLIIPASAEIRDPVETDNRRGIIGNEALHSLDAAVADFV